MSTTLISFLGRKPQGRPYEATCYDFGEGQVRESRFFGLALAELKQPDQLVILGTPGSMWDVLVEHLAESDVSESERLKLLEAAEKEQVTQPHLDTLEPTVQKALGRKARLRLIPLGRDEKQQIKILRLMAEAVKPGDKVYLDLTHGLRHLPMLGLLSALYLREARKATIQGIFYGAFDLKRDGKTPVLRLDGLLRVADWIRALAVYDHSGDYSVFGPLMDREGVVGGSLEQASFYERIFNPEKARQKLTGFPVDVLKEKPIGGLFADTISDRIKWYRQPTRSAQESELAWTFFEKKDYVRAAAYAYESLATLQVEQAGGNPSDFELRESLMQKLAENDDNIRKLKWLRNELVHGSRSKNRAIQKIVDNEESLHGEIKEILDAYLSRA